MQCDVDEVLIVSDSYDEALTGDMFDEIDSKYPIEDTRWERFHNSYMFVFPQHIFCDDDPRQSELDPWKRQIRKWKYYSDDYPLIWQDRVQLHPSRGVMFPNKCPDSVSYYAWTSICGVCIPLYLVCFGTSIPRGSV